MSATNHNILWVLLHLLLLPVGLIFLESSSFYLVLSFAGFAQFALVLYINIKTEGKIFSPLIMYEIVMYLFLFGQCLMWIFTDDYTGKNIIDIYSKDLIVKAEIFTLLSMFFFHLALFNVKPRTQRYVLDHERALFRQIIYKVGLALLCITIIPEIVYNIRIVLIAQSSGYLGIYANQVGRLLGLFLTLREFFFPAVVLILCGKAKENRFLSYFLITIVLIDATVSFYVGSRSDAMMQIITLALLLSSLNNESKLKPMVKYGIMCLVLLVVVNVVRVIRIIPDKSLSIFLEYLLNPSDSINDGLFVGLLGELGATMSTLLETMTLVPSVFDFLHGSSYLYAFTWVIPGFFTNNCYLKASMNNWLDSVRYTGSGWGFSTTAEAYFNFGFWGVILFLLFGFLIGKLFKKLDEDFLSKNPLEYALSFILFNRLLIFSRMDFLSAIPSIIYFYLCLKLLIYLLFHFSKKHPRF